MKHKVFSVFDSKAGAFLPPFLLPEVAVAQRAFRDCVGDSSHAFGRHPEDYTLIQLAVFDDASGQFDELGHDVILTGVAVASMLERDKRLVSDGRIGVRDDDTGVHKRLA